MDGEQLLIGYNTKNGKKLPPSSKRPDADNTTAQSANKPRPKGKVDVYLRGTFIKQVPLGLLVRFSTTAQEAFPKPLKKGPVADKKLLEDDEPLKADKDHRTREWAEDHEGEQVDVEKLTADIAKLSQGTQTEKDEAFITKEKKLDLGMDTLWIQPPVDAFTFAFDWMREAKSCKGTDILDFGVPSPGNIPLWKLVDLYAAALCLGLRPKPRKHMTDIFERLTASPPSLNDIVYVHEHLPVTDSVMTRAINSFLKNRSAASEVYTKSERLAIENYFHEVDEELYDRFKDILEYHEGGRRAKLRDQGALKLQKLAEGTQPSIKDGQIAGRTDASTGSSAPEGGRGRHARRGQQNGGKKVNGKAHAAS